MKITNLSQSQLTLPTGEVIAKGETVEVKNFDEKHHVLAAWLKAKLIKKSTGKAEESADDEAEEATEAETVQDKSTKTTTKA